MLLECVPNISEGRCIETLDYISAELSRITDASVLHRDVGYDANRTVFTLAGTPEGISRAVVRLAEICVDTIDMRTYEGSHPCIGALDVCPLIPLDGLSMQDCADLAEELAAELSQRFGVPIYLYENAARSPARKTLGVIRKGGFDGLMRADGMVAPDFGPPTPHLTQGAWVFGARQLLIAFNVNLSTCSIEVASRIAARIRTSGPASSERLRSLRAIGWYMPEFNCAQVSCNLPDFMSCGLKEVFDAISVEAQRESCSVTGSEAIGLLPEAALRDVYSRSHPDAGTFPLDWMESVIAYLGLNALSAFEPQKRVLERVLRAHGWDVPPAGL